MGACLPAQMASRLSSTGLLAGTLAALTVLLLARAPGDTTSELRGRYHLKQLDSIPNDYKPSQLAQVRHSILAAERRNVVGYLRKGDSLSGMPLKFKSELASRCEQACRSKRSCKAYTFHPGQALCYLKSQVRPGLGGLRCTDDCWYFGVVSK